MRLELAVVIALSIVLGGCNRDKRPACTTKLVETQAPADWESWPEVAHRTSWSKPVSGEGPHGERAERITSDLGPFRIEAFSQRIGDITGVPEWFRMEEKDCRGNTIPIGGVQPYVFDLRQKGDVFVVTYLEEVPNAPRKNRVAGAVMRR